MRKYKKEYSQSLSGRFFAIRKSAHRRNLIFEPSIEEYENYFYKQPCFYCGIKSTGIDRVDSSQGYTQGNMLSCCGDCNEMKMNRTFEEFIDQINRINRNLLKDIV